MTTLHITAVNGQAVSAWNTVQALMRASATLSGFGVPVSQIDEHPTGAGLLVVVDAPDAAALVGRMVGAGYDCHLA